MTIDVANVRKDFPILDQTINDHPLVYFDNAATTQKPKSVIDAVTNYYLRDNANVHRGLHALSERATAHYEKARTTLRHFINARFDKECIFVRGVTEAINLVAASFVQPRIRAGEEILLTHMEHHANIVPWQLVCKHTAAKLKVVPISDRGEIDLQQFADSITEDTKFCSIVHISNSLGTINNIKEMIRIAHERGVRVLIDGAQAGPHHVIDVQDLDCDFYTLSAHKMYGPSGIGLLYAKDELLESMNPYQGGGEMISRVTFESSEFQPSPHKFEAGTPHIAGVIGFMAAVEYLTALGLPAIQAYEKELLDYATDALHDVKHLHIIGTAKDKCPIISFVIDGIHAHDIGTVLNTHGIAIRAGHHCTMPVMDRFEVPATSRASFSFYNTKEEIDKMVEALKEVKEVFHA